MSGQSERRYGEDEVGLILRRATELQQRAPEVPDRSGMSLEELEEIGREVGIDPRFLRRAARELEGSGTKVAGLERLTGGPLTIDMERRVPGDVSKEALEAMAHEIQAANVGPGQAGLVGSTLSWTSPAGPNQRALQISVRAGQGETVIRIEERLGQVAIGGFVGGVVGGGVGLGVGVGVPLGAALQSVLIGTALPVGIVAGSYWIARTLYRRFTDRRQKKLLELLQRLTAVAEADLDERRLSQPETSG